MAKLTINEHGATITMANGAVVPVDRDYLQVTLGPDAWPDLIELPQGGALEVILYSPDNMLNPSTYLADGETLTAHDGCTWTRYGEEALVRTPRGLPVWLAERERLRMVRDQLLLEAAAAAA